MTQQTNVRLKLLIDSETRSVLYGEADKDFIDFLFNLLSLPLGAVIRLLNKEQMVGCLGNLYESVETLSEAYFQPSQSKDKILNPKVSFNCSTKLLPYTIENSLASLPGFVKGLATYIVMDDLTVKHISDFSIVSLFKKFNIKDVESLEEKVITLNVDEGVELLKASLQSNMVLTYVFLRRERKIIGNDNDNNGVMS